MSLFEWSDIKFSVNNAAMDNQHKGLVDTLNELHEAMSAGKARDVTAPLLDKLVRYTREHFAAEEKLMQQHGFPGYAAHIKLHQALTQQVEEFMSKLKSGNISLNLDLMIFLREWLVKHIQQEDRQYGAWLQTRGVL